MKNSKIKKTFNIILDLMMYIFLIACTFFVLVLVFGQKDIDGTNQIFGYQMRIVVSDSMEKCDETDTSKYDIKSIPVKSMVFIELVPEDEEEAQEWYNNINEGDVLTFRYVYTTQITITHRVEKKINNNDGTFTFHFVGDNKSSNNELLRQVITTGDSSDTNYIIGKVVGQSYVIGNIVTILRKPIGMCLIIIFPCLIIIFYEINRIIYILTEEKKQKAKQQQEEKENEIKMLKEKLAQLESKINNDSNSTEKTN